MSPFGRPIRSRPNGDNISVSKTEIMSPFGRLNGDNISVHGVYTFYSSRPIEKNCEKPFSIQKGKNTELNPIAAEIAACYIFLFD